MMANKDKTIKQQERYESILERDSVEFNELMTRFIKDLLDIDKNNDEFEKELIYRNKDSLPQA
jgi:hypothetical protein